MLTSEQYLELISRLDKIIHLLERLNAQHAEPGVNSLPAWSNSLIDYYSVSKPTEALTPDYKKSHEISFDPTWDDKP